MKTYDSILRQKYVERLLYFVIQKDNGGFTPDEFAKHLTSNGISPKSIKGRRNPLGKTEPDPRNDFLFTVQKAAQDYGIFFYHHGTRSKKKYYVDDRTARYLKLNGRKKEGSVFHSGSKRGFERRKRKSVEKQLTIEHLYASLAQIQNDQDAKEQTDDDDDIDIDVLLSNIDNDFSETNEEKEEIETQCEADGLNLPHFGLIEAEWSDKEDDSPDSAETQESEQEYFYLECIRNTRQSLSRYCFEGNFYFVSTFLLQMGIVDDLSQLVNITELRLKEMQTVIERQWSVKKTEEDTDEDMNTMHYFEAVGQSFVLPMQLSVPGLKRYWEIASMYHNKEATDESVLEYLTQIVPCTR